ncbi:hypothetical protein L3Q82_010739, partial [Scortum barcoo]
KEMGIIGNIKDTVSKAVFSPSTLMSGRGGLHMAQIILSLVTFILAAFRGGSSHTYWNYAMFTWAFCPIMTLIITIIEMLKLDVILNLCMDWSDFTTGMAMSSTLMTVSVAITYANFYACLKCLYGLIVSAFAFLCALVYTLEVVKDKFLDKKKGSYLAALPGFWKVLEAFVSCMIFISLTGYRDRPALILCVIAYAIPFPILPLIIATNILKKLKKCLPFNLDRGRMVSPWGVWCEFVWVFCITVPLVLSVVEAKMWHILLAVFLPNWADLTCGLTTLCAAMIASATVIFAAVFVCLSCFVNILCFILSLAATVVFVIDAVLQRKMFPSGYMCSLRGGLRTAEAFVACIILSAAADHFVSGEWFFRPLGMTCSIVVFAACLLVTVVIIVLHLLKLLQCLLSFGLNKMELAFNAVAVLLYLLAVLLWAAFGYKRSMYNPYTCDKCSFVDMNTVVIGAIVNLVLYIVDLVLSFKSC